MRPYLMRSILWTMLAMVMTMGRAEAATPRAEICYADPTDALATCQSEAGCALPTNETVFHCPTAGDATVPQLAQRGWWIVSIRNKPAAFISGANMAVEQLVIQIPDRIYRNGFEQ